MSGGPKTPPMTADTAPAWDGRPPMHEVDAFHWLLKRNGAWPEAWLWQADADGCGTEYSGAWAESDGDGQPDQMARWYAYLGPCLTPAEVSARERAACAAGAEAMREAAAKRLEPYAASYDQMVRLDPGCRVSARAVEVDLSCNMIAGIRALPIPEDAAAALAEVVRRAKEESFMLAHDVAISALLPSDGAMYSADFKAQLSAHHTLERVKAKLEEAAEAYGIRARSGEPTP